MNIVGYVIAVILFVGSFLLFGYAFDLTGFLQQFTFIGGIVCVSLSLAIPFHILGRSE